MRGGYVVVSADAAPIKDGGVLVEDGKVASIGRADELVQRFPDAAVLGSAGDVVIPGLIDAHQHGRGISNIQRGVDDSFLEQWLTRLRGLWPVDPYLSTSIAAIRLLRSGVTTAMHHFVSGGFIPLRDEMTACLKAYRDIGLRVTFTFDFRDQHSYVYAEDNAFVGGLSSSLSSAVKAQLPPRTIPLPARSRDFVREVRAAFESSTILFALGPQGADWASDTLLAELADLAGSEGLPIHTHMLETRLQAQASLQTHGVTAVQRFNRFGLLCPRTSLAHMVWVDEPDLDILSAAGTAIVHNPASNLRLRSGIAPVPAMLQRGLVVGIGMDGLSMSDRSDFFEDLRLCASLHFDSSGDSLAPDRLWQMLYAGGAKATFWGDRIGSLKPGSYADAVVMTLPASRLAAPIDPTWRVMDRVLREGSPNAVKATVVGGRILLNNGKVCVADENELMNRIEMQAGYVEQNALGDRRQLVKQLEDAIAAYYRAPQWERGKHTLNSFIPPNEKLRNNRSPAIRKRSDMLRRFIQVFALVAAALVTAAGPSAVKAQTPFQGEGGSVRVLSFPSGNDYPFWAISKLGLDKKYGFNLVNVPAQPGGAVATAFRSGAVDGGSMNWIELARLRTNNEKVTAVTPFLQMPNVFVVPTNSPIKSMADLKGKVVGTYYRFAPEWVLAVASTKKKANFDLRTDSKMHEAGPGLLRGLMEQKQLEASFIFYNLAFPMVATGEYRILSASRDLLPDVGLAKDLMLSTVSFREEYIKSNPKNVQAFVLAYQEAVRYMASNDDIWIEALARQDIKDPKLVALMRDWSRTVALERFSPTVKEDTQKIFDALYAEGGKEAIGVDKLPEGIVDLSFSK